MILSHQRSGTHFLLSSLTSHPEIHGRGEFILTYMKEQQKHPERLFLDDDRYRFRNRPDKFNIGIVMYSQVASFEELCCPLANLPVIHLLRDPAYVARSILQMRADRRHLGSSAKAHYRIAEKQHHHFPINSDELVDEKKRIVKLQSFYENQVRGHPRRLTVHYGEITGEQPVTHFPDKHSAIILNFLGLPYCGLSSRLQKTRVES